MKKSIKEWLEELPEPYRTQALENLDCDEKEFVESQARALFRAFVWDHTPQGGDYWKKLIIETVKY